METPAFERLCRELYQANGIRFAPEAINRYGDMRSVWLMAGQTPVTLIQGSPDSDHMHVIVGIGKPDSTSELASMEDLMSANFELMTATHRARFSRHPVSGELMMQCVHPTASLSADDLMNLIASMAAFPAMNSAIHGWANGAAAAASQFV